MKAFGRLFVLTVSLLILFPMLEGCGVKGEGQASSPEGAGVSGAAELSGDDSWKSKGFVIKELNAAAELENEPAFREIRCSQIAEAKQAPAGQSDQSMASYLRNSRFELTDDGQDGGNRLFLERRTSDIKEASRTELFAEGERKPKGRAVAMDAVADNDIAILFADTDGGSGWRIAHVDTEGNVLSLRELSDVYREREIGAEEMLHGIWWCDETGASYVWRADAGELLAFDESGAFVMSCPHMGIQWDDALTAQPAAFHAPDGSLIFASDDPDEEKTKLIRLDLSRKKQVCLATMEQRFLRQFMMAESGDIYYSDSNRLYKWDTRTGKRETLFSYLSSDIPAVGAFEYVEHVSVTEDGELLLYVRRKTGMEIYALSDREQEAEGIVLLDLIGESYVKSCTTIFNRSREESQRIRYKKVNGDNKDVWNRTLAEFAAGKGPDILCMWAGEYEKLDTLCEKGLIADLEKYVPQETLEQIFPGVLASGTIDGHLVGLGMEGIPIALVVSDQVWNRESWTGSDIVGLAEARPELEGIYFAEWGEQSPSVNLSVLALRHLENSEFIDWENGESHFESEEFRKILEVSRRCGNGEVRGGSQIGNLIQNGNYLMALNYIPHYSVFYGRREKFGDGTHFIGFPGQTGYVGYWNSLYLILVNAKSQNAEIGDFLQYLTSYDSQAAVTGFTPVREDVIRGQLEFMSDPDYDPEEYIQFLRKLGPGGRSIEAIDEIVSEEAEAYFAGGRDAAKTAEIIDNRVQLYLNERKR